MKTKTFTATGRRAILAHQTIEDFGPIYLNPLVGRTAAHTCANVQSVMHLLHDILNRDDDICEIQPGLALIVQTIWTATQYEGNMVREGDAEPGQEQCDG